MPNVGISVSPALSKINQRLGLTLKKIQDIAVPHKKVSIYLDRWVQDNFKTQGERVGGWAPLKIGGRWKGRGDSRKFQAQPPAKTLQDTGRLRSSFEPFSSAANAGIGSDLPYSKPHNEGAGSLPVRRMLPKKNEVIADVERIFDEHVKTSIDQGMKK